MSFDPHGYSEPPPQPPPGEAYPPPLDYSPTAGELRERVLLPAVFLVAMAVLNFLWSLGLFAVGFFYSHISPEMVKKQLEQQEQHRANVEQMEQMGWSIQDVMNIYVYGGYGGGVIVLLLSLVCLLGAIRMLMMRSYGLAMFSAVLTAVPCISPMACPCLFIGTGIGVWCMVVLLNPDVREAFR